MSRGKYGSHYSVVGLDWLYLRLLRIGKEKRTQCAIGDRYGRAFYSQTTSKLKCVGSPCRIIYTVFGKPPVSLLKLFDYIDSMSEKNLPTIV